MSLYWHSRSRKACIHHPIHLLQPIHSIHSIQYCSIHCVGTHLTRLISRKQNQYFCCGVLFRTLLNNHYILISLVKFSANPESQFRFRAEQEWEDTGNEDVQVIYDTVVMDV